MNFQKIDHEGKIDLKKFKIVMGDECPIIIYNDKPLSQFISWNTKKLFVKEIINETEISLEHIYIKSVLGFLMIIWQVFFYLLEMTGLEKTIGKVLSF